jgi:hypothetical protein
MDGKQFPTAVPPERKIKFGGTTMKSRIILCLGLLFLVASALPASAHVTQHCTVGFYKNHTQYLDNGSCTNYTFDQNTLVSVLFPDVDPCVGAMTLQQLLSSPSSACGGASTLAGGEIILLRQAITRIANGANSDPVSCDGVFGTIHQTNNTIDEAVSTDDRNSLVFLSQVFNNLNQGSCTLH